MPQCIEDKTTASNRYFVSLPALLAVHALHALIGTLDGNQDEPHPTEGMMRAAVDMVTDVPFNLLGDPDIGLFFGEIHLSWNSREKQVVLMFFPNRTPLIHHYLRVENAASEHDIEEASADRLAYWLGWLRA
jgi:hypothetical protein